MGSRSRAVLFSSTRNLSNQADVDISIDPAFFPRLRASSIKRNPVHSRVSPSVKENAPGCREVMGSCKPSLV
jgi:hypothetical protein